MKNFRNILVTGGAGFIGGCFIRNILRNTNSNVLNIDKYGYASDLSSIEAIKESKSRHRFIKQDLIEKESISYLINQFKPNLIIHFAAESHVDRSIDNPTNFINSNIIGTFNLLESTREYWEKLNIEEKKFFRFHHVSTDEVFGTLEENKFFDESSRYSPRSPYSASKAASDHLVQSWYHTYGLPIVLTNCSNNYGPYQFPEKLIPLTISKAINNKQIPIYGDGSNQRDWLYVDDHIDAILKTLSDAEVGETYCIGGNAVRTNLQVVKGICKLLNNLLPKDYDYEELITFVKDRPGHDKRYAINSKKLRISLDWEPTYSFESGLEKTVNWYINNSEWSRSLLQKSGYGGDRLGI